MKPTVTLLAVALFASSRLDAQTAPGPVGLGTAITVQGQGTGFAIHVPMALGPRRRLEPEVALQRTSNNQTTTMTLLVGTGFLFLSRPREGTRLYVGPRFGVATTRTRIVDPFTGTTRLKRLDWYVRAVAGAEHLLSPHFSLGGEARLTYLHIGETTGGGGLPGPGLSQIGTGAAALLRWYF